MTPSIKTLSLMCTLFLCACSHSIQRYSENQPALVVEDFFSGQLRASGVVKNYRGQVIRWFNADIKAYWKQGVGTLEEDFVFNDGEKQRRVWILTPKDSANGLRTYTGTAADVVEPAKISVSGNAMFLKYGLRIPYKDSHLDVNVDDKMYLSANNVIINNTKLYKFGLKVGSIDLTIYKQ